MIAQEACFLKYRESIPAALRNAKRALCNEVHAEVNGSLTCAEQIQNHGILNGEIGNSIRFPLKLFRNPGETSSDDSTLI